MAFTQEQLTARRRVLGASEVAAALGLDPFSSPSDVYWRKVLPAPEPPAREAKHFELGHRLEDLLIDYAVDRLGGCAVHRQHNVVGAHGILAATLDALIDDRPEAIEAKYSSSADGWGDEGTDQVPERVVIQCLAQAYCAGLERVWVPAFVASHRAEFRLYSVPRDEDAIAVIVGRAEAWWNTHVVAEVPPDDTPPPLDLVKRLRREPASEIVLGDEAMAAWGALELAKADAKRADAAKDEAQARVLMLLGEAEAGRMPDGRLLTYLAQNSAPSVDHARFRALAPEIYEQVVTRGSHRVLRIRKK
jgi:predicted phage-related endonuclease